MKVLPIRLINDKLSFKNKIPQIRLVTGSNMLTIDACVPPILLIPCCRHIAPTIEARIDTIKMSK